MVVAVGIFSIVMLTATGAYLSLIRLDRHARATNDVANNLAFAVDSMARAMRTGTGYTCTPAGGANGNNWNGTCTQFSFNDSETPARPVVYSLSNGRVMASVGGAAATPLTDPRIFINGLTFYLRGVGTGDGAQPNVLFTIRGEMATGPTASTTFTIQGGATQRLLEL